MIERSVFGHFYYLAVAGSLPGSLNSDTFVVDFVNLMDFFQRSVRIEIIIEIRNERIAIEIKRSATAKAARGFHSACADVEATLQWFVHSGERSFPMQNGVAALTLTDAILRLKNI